MNLFEQYRAGKGDEYPRLVVPYIGGWIAILRGRILLIEHDGREIAMEVTQESAEYFRAQVSGYDPYSTAECARAALDAAEDIAPNALRWQRSGKRKVMEGPPVRDGEWIDHI